MATDGQQTFAIYVYVNDRMQWTTGDSDDGQGGFGGTPARVGIIMDDTTSAHFIPGSGTADILNVHEASNTGLRGLWYFKVDGNTVVVPGIIFLMFQVLQYVHTSHDMHA